MSTCKETLGLSFRIWGADASARWKWVRFERQRLSIVEAHILTDMLLGDEELGAQVILLHQLIVLYGHGSNPGKDQVLRNFIRKRFHADQEDICCTKPSPRLVRGIEGIMFGHLLSLFLSFDTP